MEGMPPLSRTGLLVGALLLCAAAGCSPHRVDAVGEDDFGFWMRVGDVTGEWPLLGQAFVLSTDPGYCDLFEQRWTSEETALEAFGVAMALLPEGPSYERCDVRLTYWRARIEAEALLYFQDARHTVLFFDELTEEQGVARGSVTLAEGSSGAGEDWPDEGLPPVLLTTTRANTMVGALPQDLLDCNLESTQESMEGSFLYPGPPREVWKATAGRLELQEAGENAWSIAFGRGELSFDREVYYVAPTDANGWDPRVTDTAPRDPLTIGFDREFERCDVEVNPRQWFRILLWVQEGAA